MANIEVYNKDCLDFLRGVEDDSIDMVLTDPPYFIGFDGGQGWDSQWRNEDEYLQWCYGWTKECVRVLKDSGMLIVWGTLKTDTFLKYRLFLSSMSELCRQNEIVWSYNWGGRSKKNFARKHEYAWCYSKGEKFTFNADAVRIPRKVAKNVRTGENYSSGTIPTCVWEKNNHTMSKDFIGWHPTTKNVELLERMILAYTNPGETVLDCFLGSGSTAVASIRTGRHIIGTERDEKYYSLMSGRLEAERDISDNN